MVSPKLDKAQVVNAIMGGMIFLVLLSAILVLLFAIYVYEGGTRAW